MENVNRQQQQRRQGLPPRISKSAPCSPAKPAFVVRNPPARADSFHVIHKVPMGDTPYSQAKQVQLVEKNPERAIALFWAAINAGDRVDSALKDMAIVMKQQNRPEEAIEAIKSFRHRCSDQSQESLDNVLLDLYKRCGRLDDQITLLKQKLNLIHQGIAFNGKRTKTARSQGKKFQVSIEQEATRLLGNLGWAYMQKNNYACAEAVYRKALSIEQDNNKVCNLGICLMKQGRIAEAKAMLQRVKKPSSVDGGMDSHLKSYERAQEMLAELESNQASGENNTEPLNSSMPLQQPWLPTSCPELQKQHQNPPLIVSDPAAVKISTTLMATAGFGPLQPNPQLQKVASFPGRIPPNPQASSPFSKGGFRDKKNNSRDNIFPDENNINATAMPVSNAHPFSVNYQFEVKSHAPVENWNENGNAMRPIPGSPAFSKADLPLNVSARPFFGRNKKNIAADDLAPLSVLDNRTNHQQQHIAHSLENRVLGNNSNIKVSAPYNDTQSSFVSLNENRLPTARSLSFEGSNATNLSTKFFNEIICRQQHKNQNQDQNQPEAQVSSSMFQAQTTLKQQQQNQPQFPSELQMSGKKPETAAARIRSHVKANSVSLPFQSDDLLPESKEFDDAITAAADDLDPSLHQQRVQRRLRIFQEMSIPTSLS